jgi:hypothetical protein
MSDASLRALRAALRAEANAEDDNPKKRGLITDSYRVTDALELAPLPPDDLTVGYGFFSIATLSALTFTASAGLPNESYSMARSMRTRCTQDADGVDCFMRIA